MSDSLAISLGIVKTPASGTQYNPLGNDFEDNIEIDEDGGMTIEISGATVISLAHLTTCNGFVIKNKDSAKYIIVLWTDTLGWVNAQKLPAGRTMLIPDLDPAETFQLGSEAGGSPICKVYPFGS